jgi:hypothetical protein
MLEDTRRLQRLSAPSARNKDLGQKVAYCGPQCIHNCRLEARGTLSEAARNLVGEARMRTAVETLKTSSGLAMLWGDIAKGTVSYE